MGLLVLFTTSGKNENPCLVSDLRRKGFNISPLNLILDVGLSYLAFIMLEYIPPIQFVQSSQEYSE